MSTEESWKPSRWLSRLRWFLELTAIIAAALWASIEVAQGTYNPAAEFSIKKVSRIAADGTRDYVVISATIKVTRPRVRFENVSFGAKEFQPGGPARDQVMLKCSQLSALAERGRFPPGDSRDVACAAEVKRGQCVELELHLQGVRDAPFTEYVWQRSYWTTSTISCGVETSGA